jgi:hypothetical protein
MVLTAATKVVIRSECSIGFERILYIEKSLISKQVALEPDICVATVKN